MAKIFDIAFKLGAELTSSFNSAFKQANSNMDMLVKAGDKMNKSGKFMTKSVTAPIVGMGVAAIAVGANFEEGMSKVAAVSGASGESLEKLSAKAREVGANTQFSATEAADALNYMAMAGWDTQQMLGGIDGVMSLAAASGEDLAMVSDIVTDSLTAFGMKAEDSGRFADVLAAASSNANTNVSMLGESFKYVAPLAGALGYSAEDTSVALSLMANAGIKGSQSGTALKTMLANLASPTNKMKKSMDELGISLVNSDGTMKTLDEVMLNLRGSFSELDEVQQASAASTIFGKEAMAGALAVINASEEDYNKLTNAIGDSAGMAEKMAAVVNDNLKGRIKEMQSALEEAGISIYQNLQPALEAGVAAVSKLADWFNQLSPAGQNTVVVIAGVAAAIGPALVVMGTLVVSLANTVKGFNTAKKAIMAFGAIQKLNTKITAIHRAAMMSYMLHGKGLKGVLGVLTSSFRSLNVAMLLNPAVLITTAIVGLVAGLVIAYKRSEAFRNIVNQSFESVKNVVASTVDYVKTVGPQMWNGMIEGVKEIGEKISGFLGEGLSNGVSEIIGGFIDNFKVGMSSLPGILSLVAPAMTTLGLSFLGVSGPIGWIIGAVVSLGAFLFRLSKTNQGVADAMSNAWAVLQSAFEPILEIFSEGFAQFAEEVGPQLEQTIEVITASISELGPAFAEVGVTIGELVMLIMSTFAEMVPVIMSVGMSIFEVFQVVFPAVVSIVGTVVPIIAQLLLSIVPIILTIVQTVIPLILEVVSMVFPIVLSIIQAVLPVIVTLLTLIVGIIMQLVQVAVPLILTVIQAVLPVVLGIVQAIIPVITGVLQMLVAVINGVVIPAINAILTVVQVVFPFIQMIIETALAIINGIIQTAMALLQGDWSAAWEAIKSTATTIMNNIVSFFQGINLYEVGKSIITGLINGIKSMGSAVIGAISGMIPEPIRGGASKLLGKIPGFAEGGIISSPTLAWVGEGGDTETVIPWNNSQRSKDLWMQTGQQLGMLGNSELFQGIQAPKRESQSLAVSPRQVASANASGQVIHQEITFAPVYQIDGGDPSEVQRVVERSDGKLLSHLQEIKKNERRLAF